MRQQATGTRLVLCTAVLVALAALLLGASTAGAKVKKIAGGDRVNLEVALGRPLLLAEQTQRAFLKIGLTGFPLQLVDRRAPVNVAIVLDRSGSMSGDKIRKAREAAIMAIERLAADDIVSVVTYNHTVDVLVPATKVRDRSGIRSRINQVFSSGNTALFAGVSKGAYEVRKFIDDNRVNRVVLLSDGLANVGPSSPGALADLGYSLVKEGISVTTIGLGDGYNEDLMVALARASDGNHAFAETASDLARIFSYEFGDVLSVVARGVTVEIRCAPGIRPVRVLGRSAEIIGGKVYASLNQLYANQEKFLMIEVEIPASGAGTTREVATVDVQYTNAVTRSTDLLGGKALVRFSSSSAAVEKNRNDSVLVASVDLLANETHKSAVSLRDQGRQAEAKQLLESNAAFLDKEAKKYNSKKLKRRAASNRADKGKLDDRQWNVQRKRMRKQEYELDAQQAF